MATITATYTYRKTKTGEWVVFAPANLLWGGRTVTVTKRDGTTKFETIASVGKPFAANGQQMAYGYLQERKTAPVKRHGQRGYYCITDGQCSSFGSGRNCGGRDCDGY